MGYHLIKYLPTILFNNQKALNFISDGAMVAFQLVALKILCSIPGRGDFFLLFGKIKELEMCRFFARSLTLLPEVQAH